MRQEGRAHQRCGHVRRHPLAHHPACPRCLLALRAALPCTPVLCHGVGTARADSLVPSRSAVVQERSSPTVVCPAPSGGGVGWGGVGWGGVGWGGVGWSGGVGCGPGVAQMARAVVWVGLAGFELTPHRRAACQTTAAQHNQRCSKQQRLDSAGSHRSCAAAAP
jgi:hypothetical protein